ncbi:MAG TPA: hypothetical protein VF682_25375 [Pseudomonas sp.]
MRYVHIHLPKISGEPGRKYHLNNPQRGSAFAFRIAIWWTPPTERREAERRWAMDGPSARAHTTAPE